MSEVLQKFIYYIKSDMSKSRLALGKQVFSNILKEYVIDMNLCYPPILDVLLQASYIYFDSYYKETEVELLKNFALKEVEELYRKSRDTRFRLKYKLLKPLLKETLVVAYKMEHKKVHNRNVEDNKLYKMYEDFIDVSDENSGTIFMDFDMLVNQIDLFGFSTENLCEIVLEIAKLNYKHYSEAEVLLLDTEKIKNHDFKYISKKQISKLIDDDDVICDFLSDDSKKDKLKREELSEFIKQNSLDISDIIEAWKTINEHYKQVDELNENDIILIYESLIKLGIQPKICRKIAVCLNKKINRVKQEEVLEPKEEVKPVLTKKSNLITDKEFKAIKKELATYFDFYNVEFIRALTVEEIIHCIELLVKIDSPIEEIRRFIRFTKIDDKEYIKQNLGLLNDNNCISVYIELYNKLKFYEEKLSISLNLRYIEEYLQEMFICSSEDYEFYKNAINEELRKILVLLPQTYEYEIKEKTNVFNNKSFK